jgi:hypothetical protein
MSRQHRLAISPNYEINRKRNTSSARSVLPAGLDDASGISRYADEHKETVVVVHITWYRRRLTDRDALDVEDQVRVGRDVRGRTLLAVCERSGDGEATFTARGHAGDTDVPALDNLADAKLEGEWLALLVGYKLSAFVHVGSDRDTHSRRPCRS